MSWVSMAPTMANEKPGRFMTQCGCARPSEGHAQAGGERCSDVILRLASKDLDDWISRRRVGDNDALAYVECYLRRECSLATTGCKGCPTSSIRMRPAWILA
jgi:hypothetical protein